MLRRGACLYLLLVALALIGVPASAGDARRSADPATTVRVDVANAAHAAALPR